jgi:GNAT superfamily N-acetyltransferase
MNINHKNLDVQGIKISIKDNGKEIGRAFLYILKNDLRAEPFGYMEDVFVDENYRKAGMGTKLVEEVIRLAKEKNCYKIVATSRYGKENVHRLYEKLGFKDFGKEFKVYL